MISNKLSLKDFHNQIIKDKDCRNLWCSNCPASVVISGVSDCIIRHNHKTEISEYYKLDQLPERFYLRAIKELKDFLNIKDFIQEEMEI